MAMIDLPTGGYQATFRILPDGISRVEVPVPEGQVLGSFIENGAETSVRPTSPPPMQPGAVPSGPPKRGWLRSALPFVLLLMVAAVSWIFWRSRTHAPFDDFWAPAFASAKAITIYNAEDRAYGLPCATQADDPRTLGMYRVPCKQGHGLESPT
jgi:hypothetical protein